MILGITGKIGSGKSTLLKKLRKNGFKIILMDEIGHEILEEKIKNIKELFNIKECKNIRSKLREIVFEDKNKLEKLNSVLHPLMKKRLKKIINNCKEKKIAIEAAVLFEMNIEDLMDKIVYLDVNDEIAIERVKKRSHLSDNEILKIINSQKKYDQVKDKIDIYINTSTISKEDVYKAVVTKLNLEVEDAG